MPWTAAQMAQVIMTMYRSFGYDEHERPKVFRLESVIFTYLAQLIVGVATKRGGKTSVVGTLALVLLSLLLRRN